MNVVVSGNLPREQLLSTTEQIRDEILRLEGVSKVRFLDKPSLELSIEIAPKILDQYGLSMTEIANRIKFY